MRILLLIVALSGRVMAGDMDQGGLPISTGVITTAALTGAGTGGSNLGVNSSSVAVYNANRNLAVPYGVIAATITTTGNVGIGTSSPGTLLHVASGTLTVNGTGSAVTLSNNTALTVNSTATFNSQTNFINALSTQATFSGFSHYGAVNANSGSISVGKLNQGLLLDYDNGTGNDVHITNMQDAASSDMFFGVRGGAVSPLYPLIVRADGSVDIGTATFTAPMSTGAYFSGMAKGLSNTSAGSIKLGSGGVLQYDHVGTSDVFLENTQDAADADVVIQVRSNNAATTLQPLRVAGSGLVSISGQTLMWVRTKAQIDAITPAAAGAQAICSDCTVPYDLCVATGTTLSGFRATINSAINTAIPGTLVPKGCGTGQ